jgi:hypothetical protein
MEITTPTRKNLLLRNNVESQDLHRAVALVKKKTLVKHKFIETLKVTEYGNYLLTKLIRK